MIDQFRKIYYNQLRIEWHKLKPDQGSILEKHVVDNLSTDPPRDQNPTETWTDFKKLCVT